MPYVPPWEKAPDAGEEYAKGLTIGAHVAEENARLEQESQRAQMEVQMRKESLARQTQLQQARLAVEQSYRQQQADLGRARLQEVAQANAIRTKAAAQKLAAQQRFNELQPTMGTSKAMFAAGLATPGLAAQMDRGEQIDQERKDNQALRKRALDIQESREKRLGADKSQNMSALKTALDNTADPVEQKRIHDQMMEMAGARPWAIPLGPNNRPANMAAPKSPYKEGALIRHKKDGKLYRIQNGAPVLVDDQSADEGD